MIALVMGSGAIVLGSGFSTVFSNVGNEVSDASVPNLPAPP